ncbi:MAG: chorismate synthase [Deltaproteobacteria bacterium]|nr:chorismate synthase [Deltaproteobacteria bacterium]
MKLRYMTSGESHGKCLMAIVDGVPAGMKIDVAGINAELKRRQGGYGRGGRQLIESDTVEVLSGLRNSVTLGSPLTLKVENRDWENWTDIMDAEHAKGGEVVTRPRPGHADLTGILKYGFKDARNVLERSSARETAARVAVGAVAKQLIKAFDIDVYSWVTNIGGVGCKIPDKPYKVLFRDSEASKLRCPSKAATVRMVKKIDTLKKAGDSLGGIFEVVATGLPPGLGSYTQWDRKLDARLSMALMSIQAIKGVEVGLGFDAAITPGSKVHDEIFFSKKAGYNRKTNRAGGLEGGMTNGEPLVLRAAMKPIPTLYKPLRSVDIKSKKPFKASIERSDICAVPAASVVAESVVGIELASAFLEKFGGDSFQEISRNYKGYLKQISKF